jgi:hypothetical protein
MLSLVYLSVAAKGLERNDLHAIGEEARRFNVSQGITGLLAYNGRHFLQLLEGRGNRVEELLGHIAHDPRHHDLVVIRREERVLRECGGWSMLVRLVPVEGIGASLEGGEDALPPGLAPDTRLLFTSFASVSGGTARAA